MTIKKALTAFPQVESELLVAGVLKKPKEFLYLHPQQQLTKNQEQNFIALAKRRLRGEPMAYILGYKYFYGLKFKVNKNVLIPRPETEWLVDRAMMEIKKRLNDGGTTKPIRVLDLGTGSGCIAISIAKQLDKNSKVKIFASDISAPALKVAKSNARSQRIKITFLQSDLFAKIKGKFDLIVANPPYVTMADYKKLNPTLKYEPRIALSALRGNKTLYTKLFRQLPEHLNNGASLFLELDPSSPALLRKLIPSKQVKFFRDYQGLWRYAQVVLPRSKSQ